MERGLIPISFISPLTERHSRTEHLGLSRLAFSAGRWLIRYPFQTARKWALLSTSYKEFRTFSEFIGTIMTGTKPHLHNEIYPFIQPSKFVGSLKKKVVVITGKSYSCPNWAIVQLKNDPAGAVGTIGNAIGECFATSGASLVLVFNRTEPPTGTKDRLTSLGAHSVTFLKCNVAQLSDCRALVQQVRCSIFSDIFSFDWPSKDHPNSWDNRCPGQQRGSW